MQQQLVGREVTSCGTCPVGAASGIGRGGRCPMVDRRRRAGACLYVAGESVERIWFLKRGTVVLSRPADDRHGEAVVWAVRGPGAILGAEGFVRTTYADSARAVDEVVVCGAPRSEMASWLATHPEAARAVLDCVLHAMSADAPRRAGADGSAVQRVARWILEETKTPRKAALPRAVVAELLGIKPETLSRTLATLSLRGAISVTRRSITVKDAAALEEAADGRHAG